MYLVPGQGTWRIWFSFHSRQTIGELLFFDPDSRQAQAPVVQIPARVTMRLGHTCLCCRFWCPSRLLWEAFTDSQTEKRVLVSESNSAEGRGKIQSRFIRPCGSLQRPMLIFRSAKVHSCDTSSLRCLRPTWTRREFEACGLRICCHGRPSSWSLFGYWRTRYQVESSSRLMCA